MEEFLTLIFYFCAFFSSLSLSIDFYNWFMYPWAFSISVLDMLSLSSILAVLARSSARAYSREVY